MGKNVQQDRIFARESQEFEAFARWRLPPILEDKSWKRVNGKTGPNALGKVRCLISLQGADINVGTPL